MSKLNLAFIATALTLIILAGQTAAQQNTRPTIPGAIEIMSDGSPASQSVSLDTGQKQELNFVVHVLGCVTGRVFDEMDPAATDKPGIGGVKVTLRSRDTGFERFVFEQYTDANGTYDFKDLRPGKYKIEIDPATLPAGYRRP